MIADHPECRIVCITEHWKSEEELKYMSLKDFNLTASYCRESNKHGGSAVYVHKSIKGQTRIFFSKFSIKYQIEIAAMECDLQGELVLVLSVYRPSGANIEIFFDRFESLLSAVMKENKVVIVAGDFNVEMLKNNANKEDFGALLESFGLKQTIFENTRISKKSSSCIDNIFVNLDNIVHSVVLHTFTSDHTAQKLTFKIKKTL